MQINGVFLKVNRIQICVTENDSEVGKPMYIAMNVKYLRIDEFNALKFDSIKPKLFEHELPGRFPLFLADSQEAYTLVQMRSTTRKFYRSICASISPRVKTSRRPLSQCDSAIVPLPWLHTPSTYSCRTSKKFTRAKRRIYGGITPKHFFPSTFI